MSFTLAHPLGLLALLALPLIVWLHRHVVQARRRQVSCLALWAERSVVRSEGAVRQRVPDRFVLALELLAALALALLLAGFDASRGSAPRPSVGFVIDGSASMAGGSPGQRPIQQIRGVLARLAREHPDLAVSMVLAAELPELLGERAMTPRKADELLAALEPRGSSCALDAGLSLISALGVPSEGTLVFSDDPELAHPRLVRVGRPEPNTAIVQARWESGEAPFVVVRRYGGAKVKTWLEVDIDGASSRRPLSLDDEDEHPFELSVGAAARQVTLSLPEDALRADNRVILLRPLERRVSLRAAGLEPRLQRALDRALLAIPKLEVAGAGEAALSVTQDQPPAAAGAGTTLTFLTRGAGPSRVAFRPEADPFSALLAGYDGHDLIWHAFDRVPPAGARVLLQADQQALIWRQGAAYAVNVDLERSNLLSHSTFPIVLANLADEIDASLGGLPRRSFAQGERVRFARAAGFRDEARLRTPSGRVLDLDVAHAVDLGVLSESGIYDLSSGALQERFAVALLSPSESEISRRAPVRAAVLPRLVTTPRVWERESMLRVPLLLAALALCGLAYLWLEGVLRRPTPASRASRTDARA